MKYNEQRTKNTDPKVQRCAHSARSSAGSVRHIPIPVCLFTARLFRMPCHPSIPPTWRAARATHRRKMAPMVGMDFRSDMMTMITFKATWLYHWCRRPRVADRDRSKIFAEEDHAKIETPPRPTATTSRQARLGLWLRRSEV